LARCNKEIAFIIIFFNLILSRKLDVQRYRTDAFHTFDGVETINLITK
jgi:hypothetical protein